MQESQCQVRLRRYTHYLPPVQRKLGNYHPDDPGSLHCSEQFYRHGLFCQLINPGKAWHARHEISVTPAGTASSDGYITPCNMVMCSRPAHLPMKGYGRSHAVQKVVIWPGSQYSTSDLFTRLSYLGCMLAVTDAAQRLHPCSAVCNSCMSCTAATQDTPVKESSPDRGLLQVMAVSRRREVHPFEGTLVAG